MLLQPPASESGTRHATFITHDSWSCTLQEAMTWVLF